MIESHLKSASIMRDLKDQVWKSECKFSVISKMTENLTVKVGTIVSESKDQEMSRTRKLIFYSV